MEETAIGTEAFQDIEVFPTQCTQILGTGLHQPPGRRSAGVRGSCQVFPFPSLPFQGLCLQTGPLFSPPGIGMGVSPVHQALRQVAPQYLGSQPLPKKVSAQAQRQRGRISWGVHVYR